MKQQDSSEQERVTKAQDVCSYYTDLHVHIGRAGADQPVKIAASPRLTLDNAISECVDRKGIHIVGIIDAVTTPVYTDLQRLTEKGLLTERAGGGLATACGNLTIIPGAELEIATGGRAAHYLVYFPDLAALGAFRQLITPRMTNMNLSSQVVRIAPLDLLRLAGDCRGLVMLAHAFTPYKGYFGHCARRLSEHFASGEVEQIAAIELGLSADTAMADMISELHDLPYVASSDAHSLHTIDREYTEFRLREPSFSELELALRGSDPLSICAYYGLDPRLGKYYRTFCPHCNQRVPLAEDRLCPTCKGRVVTGVFDRIQEIADRASDTPGIRRPPYIHQVPLQFIPGIGPKTLEKLLEHFGTHMTVLHEATEAELKDVVGAALARRIAQARRGELSIIHGAGGHYGRVDM